MIFKWFKNKGSPADAARDAAVPRHIGELWMAIQETAEREDSSWSDRNVISYYHEGAEAQKDILRWLAIYQRSIDPEHEFGFPGTPSALQGLLPRAAALAIGQPLGGL